MCTDALSRGLSFLPSDQNGIIAIVVEKSGSWVAYLGGRSLLVSSTTIKEKTNTALIAHRVEDAKGENAYSTSRIYSSRHSVR